MDFWQAQHILLGTGGAHPGLAAYDLLSGELTEALPLAEGDSVYSIAVSPDDGTVAVGTKSGRAFLLRRPGKDLQGGLGIVETYEGGMSVLSICFVGPSTLAISDVAGGFVLWQIGETRQPERRMAGTAVLYALFRLDDERLAGLSVSGELLIWNMLTSQLVEEAAVPTPPDFAALVKPVYWQQEDLWVWPGRRGVIVLYSHKDGVVRTIRGHAGDLYAIAVCGRGLITIGAADRRIKRWQRGCDEPVATQAAPEAVISATMWDQRGSQVLLMNRAGRAALYSWSSGQLERVKVLPGEDYRVALGPETPAFESAVRYHQAEKAKQLVQQADEHIARGRWGELEPIYQQLTRQGYPHVMWALRGRQARRHDDLLGELKAYHALAAIIPHDQDGSRDALRRYGELLELVWDLQGAEPVSGARRRGGSPRRISTEDP